MSSSDDTPKPERRPRKTGSTRPDAIAPREQEMGLALRSVYQRTVDEQVPDDLMDLLGKLG